MKKNKINIVIIVLMIYWDSLYLNTGERLSEGIKYFILLGLTIFCIIKGNKSLTIKKVIYLYFPIYILVLSCVINHSFSMGYIVKALILLVSFHLVEIINWESFKKIYTNTMAVICGYSLIFYILSNLFWEKMLPFYEKFLEINRNQTVFFYNMGLTNLAKDLYSRSRNYGIFQEPGAYVIFILAALMILLFCQNKNKYFLFKFAILSAALLSTLSTSGILCYVLLIFTYFFSQYKLSLNKVLIAAMIFCGGILLIFQTDLMRRVFEKFILQEGSMDHSFSGRIYAIFINVKIWMNNIFLGVGPRDYIKEFYGMKKLLSPSIWVSQTNTILGIFSVFGAIIGGQFVYLLHKFSQKIYYKKWVGYLIFAIWIFLLFSQDYEYSLFLHMITFYGIKKKEMGFDNETVNNMCTSL